MDGPVEFESWLTSLPYKVFQFFMFGKESFTMVEPQDQILSQNIYSQNIYSQFV